MGDDLIKAFQNYFNEVALILPKLAMALIAFILFWIVANQVKKIIRKRSSIFKLDDILIINFLASLSKGIILVIGFSVSLSILGLAGIASGIVTGAGVSAVILGFAFKNVGENFISGVMLIINRPFVTGDLISVADITGTVVSLNLKSTDIRTFDGKMVYVPNTMVINNPLVNFTAEGRRRFEFDFEVDISNNVDVCRTAIITALGKVPEILDDPKPLVTLTQVSSNLRLKTLYWLAISDNQRNMLEVNSDAIEQSKKMLKEAGVDISNVNYLNITNKKIPVDIIGSN